MLKVTRAHNAARVEDRENKNFHKNKILPPAAGGRARQIKPDVLSGFFKVQQNTSSC